MVREPSLRERSLPVPVLLEFEVDIKEEPWGVGDCRKHEKRLQGRPTWDWSFSGSPWSSWSRSRASRRVCPGWSRGEGTAIRAGPRQQHPSRVPPEWHHTERGRRRVHRRCV